MNSENTVSVLEKLGLDKIATEEDIAVIRETCAVMSQRGAYIVAAGIIITHTHPPTRVFDRIESRPFLCFQTSHNNNIDCSQ